MKYIKWFIYNSIIAFVFIDATIGITFLQDYNASLAPIIALLLFTLTIIYGIVLIVIASTPEDIELRTLYKIQDSFKSSKISTMLKMPVFIILFILLSAHSFYFTAFVYLSAIIVGRVDRGLSNIAEEAIENRIRQVEKNT